jgi:hypothetical protein
MQMIIYMYGYQQRRKAMKLKINKATKVASNSSFSTIDYLNDNGVIQEPSGELVIDFIPSGFGRGYKKGLRSECPDEMCRQIVALNRALELVKELESNPTLKNFVQNYSLDGDFVKLSQEGGRGSRSFPIKLSEVDKVRAYLSSIVEDDENETEEE